jgi:hypothetical protein
MMNDGMMMAIFFYFRFFEKTNGMKNNRNSNFGSEKWSVEKK